MSITRDETLNSNTRSMSETHLGSPTYTIWHFISHFTIIKEFQVSLIMTCDYNYYTCHALKNVKHG